MSYIEYTVMVHDNGNKLWYLNGLLHREDGPAVEHADGSKLWYKNGKWHREDGPAVEHINGDKTWYLNGLLHREDGPACELWDGYKSWCLNGEELTEAEWRKRVNPEPDSCIGKVVEIEGRKYRLTSVEE